MPTTDQTTLETLLRLAIVPGMGPARTTVLLRRFGSVERVLGTTAAQIAEVPRGTGLRGAWRWRGQRRGCGRPGMPDAWGQSVISSVAQRGLDPLLEALWTHAAQVVAEENAVDGEEEEPWRP